MRQGRAAVTPRLVAADALRAVDMPQGEVVDGGGKGVRRDVRQRADFVFVRLGGLAAGGVEVAGGDKRQVGIAAQGFGVGDGGGVMGADAVKQFRAFVGGTFARFGAAQVAFAQIRHGADDGFRRAAAVIEQQHFGGGLACGADDVDVERAQDVARRVEEGGRVVVAGGDDDVATMSGGDAAEELVILRLALCWRGAAVEDVAGDDERVDAFGVKGGGEPVEEGGEFVMTAATVEVAAEVNVGGVQDFHGSHSSPGNSASACGKR